MPHPVRVMFVIFAVALAGNSASADTDGQQEAMAVLSQYKLSLKHALQTGMKAGAVNAVSACNVQAPQIKTTLSNEAVHVGRSSHRLRNPDNAPPAWVSPVLASYLSDPDSRQPTSVPLTNGRTGYVEPIFLQPTCTTCHGHSIAKEVAAKILDLYPQDQAVGFAAGELRGVFWLEY